MAKSNNIVSKNKERKVVSKPKAEIKKYDFIYSPSLQLKLFSLLIFFTPFLMLMNYLQEAVGELSRLYLPIKYVEIPYTLVLFVLFVIGMVLIYRSQINKGKLITWLVIIIMFYFGQKVTDYYYDHKFYDLQYNWHYFAYGLYSFMIYRNYKWKNFTDAQIILRALLITIFISSCDEGFQLFAANRVFDISDVSKDAWGAIIGLIVLYFVIDNGRITSHGWKFRHKNIKDYLKNPITLLFHEIIFGIIFIIESALISDFIYWYYSVFITLFIYSLFFIIFHFSQFKVYKIIFSATAIILICIQSFFLIKYHNKNIVYNNFGITVYNGIPIPFFDFIIFPDGSIRMVDKKHSFNQRDLKFLLKLSKDILIVGSGNNGGGGKGFGDESNVQFMFNPNTNKGLQVIILTTPEACKEFNKLKSQGKNVLFILHNT